MKRYTLKTIKKTKVYQANIEAVRAIYPGPEEDFARELMAAANHLIRSGGRFLQDENRLIGAFVWSATPQGNAAWASLYWAIHAYKMGANKK